MSNSANQLGGKCPYMPYLGRGQMTGGEHVLHSVCVCGGGGGGGVGVESAG